MIYDCVDVAAPIRQGDIFSRVPVLDADLEQVVRFSDTGETEVLDLLRDEHCEELAAIVKIRYCTAIVVSQDCDAARGEYVSLAEVFGFSAVSATPPSTPKKWQRTLTQLSREKLRYFYLPPASSGDVVTDRSAVDLRAVFRCRLEDLKRLRARRSIRLNDVADEHFREQIAQFFRRYPYDEWYVLDKQELGEYCADKGAVEPFDWQQ